VITAQDIEATGATDLNELLETVPGFHVRLSSDGYNPIYTIRGLSSVANPEVLVLINGIPINNLQYGNRSIVWGGMPINAISRIEIIRGPGSAVYGADAYSGVINIITKTKDEINGTETGMRLGSFNTQDAWILHGSEQAGFDIAATLEYHTTDGHKETITEDIQTTFDKAFKTNASLAPGSVNLQQRSIDARLDISKNNWQLRAGYQGRRNIGTGAGVVKALAPPDDVWADDRINADLTYHNPDLTEYWDVTTQISYYRKAYRPENNQRVFPPGAFGGAYPDGFIGNPGASESHNRLKIFGFYSKFNDHLIRIGAGYHYSDLYKTTESKNFGINPITGTPLPPGSPVMSVSDTPYVYLPEGDRKAWYISLQDAWKINDNWELTAGIRYDNYSDFGTTINPRMAFVWQMRPELVGKLLYGSAFRAPSFTELYIVNNPVGLGNLNLSPETIDTWELAFDYRATSNLHLALNLFNYEATDKILLLADPGGETNTHQNIGTQKGRGLELEARWKLTKKASLLANYAFTKATDEKNNHDAGDYPRHSAYIRADWLFYPNWFLDTQINWIANRERAYGDPRAAIDDYTTVNLTLRRKNIKHSNWNFALGVRNLFDADAREPSQGPDSNGMISIPNDLPLAGRNYFLELRYRF
jgi:iron complex outermembrane receptor protein